MKTIWKFQLEVTGQQTIKMPRGAQILSVQFQNGVLCLWAVVDKGAEVQTGRQIVILGTGWDIAGEPGRFIGTVQQGPLVWHVFEIVP